MIEWKEKKESFSENDNIDNERKNDMNLHRNTNILKNLIQLNYDYANLHQGILKNFLTGDGV